MFALKFNHDMPIILAVNFGAKQRAPSLERIRRMKQDFLPGNEDELVLWATHFVTVATANSTALVLTTPQITDFNTKTQALSTARQNVEDKRKAAEASVEDKDIKKRAVVTTARDLNRYIQGQPGVKDNIKTDLGLSVRKPHPKPVKPVTPADLKVVTDWSGFNALKWKSGGNTSGVLYEVQALFGDAAEWTVIATTSVRSFTHHGVTPGMRIEYRVAAKRRTDYSGYTDVAVAYPKPNETKLILQKAA